MGDVFIPHPFLALLPAAAFLIAAKAIRLKFLFWIAATWGVYSVYEYLMLIRVLCSGECDIRIDLLVIYPAIVLLTASGLICIPYSLATRKHGPQVSGQ
jgi:hypothetical protein